MTFYEGYEDAMADDYRARLYDEAIEAFTTERLHSYYLQHPAMAQAACGMIREMDLLKAHPIAALIFSASAIEITIKDLLAKPVLNGLVHNEAAADIVMRLTPREVGSEAFKNLLFGMLEKLADVDLATYKRAGSSKTLWEEYKQLQRERNNLIHNGVAPSRETLKFFDSVAHEFLGVVFPKVLRGLGLDVTGYLMIHTGAGFMAEDDLVDGELVPA